MITNELTPILNTDFKREMIYSFLEVIKSTCPALAVVFTKYLLPENSERSLKLQANLQIETFAELLELWTEGIAEEQLIQALPYFLEILKHHLTEKGTDDFLQFDENGNIPLEQSILNYNQIASDLARGAITLEEAISLAHKDVVTPDLQNLETDLKKLFVQLRGKPSIRKRVGIRLFDLRHSLLLKRKEGMMSMRKALRDPNVFIMVANLQAIDRVRKNIDELDQKTQGKLKKIVEYTQQMLIARYSGGNDLLQNVNTSVDLAIEIGTDTVLIGFTYGMGLLARASADPEFLKTIVDQQADLIESMTSAARVIRLMNDASPTALSVWGEGDPLPLRELEWLRREVGFELNPKEFFIELRETAKTRPNLQRYVDFYARQIVDAGQGEYNIGLFATAGSGTPNTWESFLYNMDFLAQDYTETRLRLWESLSKVDPTAADFIGKMVGYHNGLYSFAKGDFDEERDIVDLTQHSAKGWRGAFSESREEQLAVFMNMYKDAKDTGHVHKEKLLEGLLMNLDTDGVLMLE